MAVTYFDTTSRQRFRQETCSPCARAPCVRVLPALWTAMTLDPITCNMTMAPDILVLSEKKALLYEPEGREVCISVTDIDDDELPVLSRRFISILRLAFTDIDEPDEDPSFLLFNAAHATAIVKFAAQWRDVDRIVIHCMAGQSRSPGIAMGLYDLFSTQPEDMAERYPWANPWVRDELVRVGRLMMQPQFGQDRGVPAS